MKKTFAVSCVSAEFGSGTGDRRDEQLQYITIVHTEFDRFDSFEFSVLADLENKKLSCCCDSRPYCLSRAVYTGKLSKRGFGYTD